jgi:hypothetical protein
MESRTIWRRRILMMLVVGLAIAIPLTLILRDSGEPAAESAQPSLDEVVPLNPVVGDSEIDAVYQVPKGWRLEREGRTLTLRSRDETAQIGIGSPGKAEESDAILDEALAALKDTYDDVEVSPGTGKRVGGLPAEGAVVSAKSQGAELRILVAVTEGRRRAYLVEVFTAASAPPGRVAEAQRFLDSLELKG